MRIGQAYDIHQLVEGRDLILGGVMIPHDKGLLGHSDADCLLHAIAESLLGALALGDLGTYFPDDDIKYKNMDSMFILKECYQMVLKKGYDITNIDTTIIAQRPKMRGYIDLMRKNIAGALNVDVARISIKATTNEKLGPIGEEKAIACLAISLLEEIKKA